MVTAFVGPHCCLKGVFLSLHCLMDVLPLSGVCVLPRCFRCASVPMSVPSPHLSLWFPPWCALNMGPSVFGSHVTRMRLKIYRLLRRDAALNYVASVDRVIDELESIWKETDVT